MNISDIMTIGQHALWVTVMIASPVLLAGLAAGLVISIFQAATQINEMTLSFVPKIVVMGVVMLLAGSWMLNTLMDFTVRLVHSIPGLISG